MPGKMPATKTRTDPPAESPPTGPGITAQDLIDAMFGPTPPEEYSIAIRGQFGKAGLRRMNSDLDERADNEPYGDWQTPVGSGPVIVAIHDEDEARPEEGTKAMQSLASAMAACGRRQVRQLRRGSRLTVTYSAGTLAPAAELSRWRAWKRQRAATQAPGKRGGG